MNNSRGMKRVAVGMSGGVDSSLAAALLKEQGYAVTGVFLECWRAPGCRTDEDRKDALEVALQLKIPFEVLDFRREYKDRVVEYFYREYEAGWTPNPDAMCNREIKFGMFYDWSLKNGFDYVATGHYARIRAERKGTGKNSKVAYQLLRGVDEKKDQSYFLYQLKPEQLEHILFPVGGMRKEEVRREARKRKLKVADKPDSQGICFIGEIDVRAFLEERIKPKRGEVVDTKGNVIGEHDGVWFYTIGQRSGFRVNQGKLDDPKAVQAIPPFYVVDKDVGNNRLIVGFGAETYRSQFEVGDLNWLSSKFEARNPKEDVLVRIRHGGSLIRAGAKTITKDLKLFVELEEAQRGVAPGQSAVFYDSSGVVIGGGVIN